MVNDGVLCFGIRIHEGHTRLQDGNDVHLEPRLGNVTKMKLVFAEQTTYFIYHHSLPGHAWVEQPHFVSFSIVYNVHTILLRLRLYKGSAYWLYNRIQDLNNRLEGGTTMSLML